MLLNLEAGRIQKKVYIKKIFWVPYFHLQVLNLIGQSLDMETFSEDGSLFITDSQSFLVNTVSRK